MKQSVENADNDLCVMINTPQFHMLATARIQKMHKHPRTSNKRSRRSTKLKFKESQKQCATESRVFHPVAAAAAASFHRCRTSSCGAMGHRGRFLFFTTADIFGRSKCGSNISSRTCCCVSMACKEFTVVWTCWPVAASFQRISL